MARTKAHGFVGARITVTHAPRLPSGWSLWPESTIELDPSNAPLPGFAVIRCSNPLDFGDLPRYPGPRDAGLLIEMAESSLREDLGTMLECYARAGIPAYWVLDVTGRRILAHSEPRTVEGRGESACVVTYRTGQEVPLVLDGVESARIPFDELPR